MSNRRPTSVRYVPCGVTAVWLLAGIAALLFAASCRRGVPAVDAAEKLPSSHATINGTVRGAEGSAGVSGRTVSVVNVKTGQRRAVQTTSTGAFTIELPAGEYRLDVDVRDGETVLKHPNVVALDAGEIDSQVEFVVAAARLARPRGPAYRVDNGLGSPIA